jgi:hypothetical protein
MKRLCLVLAAGLVACAGLPLRLGVDNISLTEVTSGAAANMNLQLSELVASVTVL